LRARSAWLWPPEFLGHLPGQCVGDGLLTLVAAVQVDHGGAGGGVSHPVHQLALGRARVGREGVPGVAQVMEVDGREPCCAESWHPDSTVEVTVPQRAACRAGEQQRVVSGRDVGHDVQREIGRWPPAGGRRWRPRGRGRRAVQADLGAGRRAGRDPGCRAGGGRVRGSVLDAGAGCRAVLAVVRGGVDAVRDGGAGAPDLLERAGPGAAGGGAG